MSDLRQIVQHPDAEQLNAFAENALPAQERERTLLHLATCEDCRAIMHLAQDAAAGEDVVVAAPAPAKRTPWFSTWKLAWPIATALAAMALLTVYLRRSTIATPTPSVATHASVQPPATPLPGAASESKAQGPDSGSVVPHDHAPARPPGVAGALMPGHAAARQELSPTVVAGLPVQGRNVGDMGSASSNGQVGFANGAAGSTVDLRQRATLDGNEVVKKNETVGAEDRAQPAAGGALAPPAGPVTAAPANGAARSAGETVEVNAESAAVAVDNLSLASMVPHVAIAGKLPSHLAVASSISNDGQTLALDIRGNLFRSSDGGRHWKHVATRWQGQAVRVNLVADAASNAAVGAFTAGRASAGLPGRGVAMSPQSLNGKSAGLSLAGTVTDASGASVPGATVSVTAAGSSLTRTTKTDAQGQYRIDGLTTGDYHVQGEAPGFERWIGEATLAGEPVQPLNLKLAIGAATETVTVTSGDEIDTTDYRASRAKKAPRVAAPSVFQLTTDRGDVWTSSDGRHWQPK